MSSQATLIPLIRGQWLPMTSEEFDEWVPEGVQAEWVDGKGIIFVSTSTWHGDLVGFFYRLLSSFVELFALGRVYMGPVELRLFDGSQRREPDIFVVLEEDFDKVRPKWVDGRASLVIEFVSESSVRNDEVDKLIAYQDAGIDEYLMIFTFGPNQAPILRRLDDRGMYHVVPPDDQGRYHLHSVPGFWFDAAWVRDATSLPKLNRALKLLAPAALRREMQSLFDEDA